MTASCITQRDDRLYYSIYMPEEMLTVVAGECETGRSSSREKLRHIQELPH